MSQILTSQSKIVIWQDDEFVITTPSIPHISKTDGGHLIVSPVNSVQSIGELSDAQILKLMKLVGFCEMALIQVLEDQGIEVPFTNNQDNGNWSVHNNKPKSLHFHIYGRAKQSVKQTFGQAIFAPDPNSGFYDNNEPLSQADIDRIRSLIVLQPFKNLQI